MKFPDQNTDAALSCGGGNRFLITSDLSLEQNDIFNGPIASGAICGGCWFANAPGAAPPGVVQPDYAHPIGAHRCPLLEAA